MPTSADPFHSDEAPDDPSDDARDTSSADGARDGPARRHRRDRRRRLLMRHRVDAAFVGSAFAPTPRPAGSPVTRGGGPAGVGRPRSGARASSETLRRVSLGESRIGPRPKAGRPAGPRARLGRTFDVAAGCPTRARPSRAPARDLTAIDRRRCPTGSVHSRPRVAGSRCKRSRISPTRSHPPPLPARRALETVQTTPTSLIPAPVADARFQAEEQAAVASQALDSASMLIEGRAGLRRRRRASSLPAARREPVGAAGTGGIWARPTRYSPPTTEPCLLDLRADPHTPRSEAERGARAEPRLPSQLGRIRRRGIVAGYEHDAGLPVGREGGARDLPSSAPGRSSTASSWPTPSRSKRC